MKAGQMETKDNRRAVEAVEKEIENIARLRFSTAYEKRTKSLKEEVEVAKNELTLQGLGHSGALVKKLVALHSKVVRDIVFDVFHSFKEEYLEHYLSTSEQFLDRMLKAFEELIEDRFSERRENVKEEVLRTGLGDSLLAWALNEMDEKKSALSGEVRREIEVLRSNTKIHLATAEQGTQTPILAGLRKWLTDDQRKVLNTILEYYREHQDWVPARILHHQIGKGPVLSAVEPLGGSVVFRTEVGGKDYYELTLLGVLLSDYGSEAEKLLMGYLDYVRAQYDQNPLVEKVTADEIRQSLELKEEQAELLGALISLGYFYGGSLSPGKRWECGVPKDVDDLPAIGDLREYVQKRAIRDYDPRMPIEPNDRLLYSLSKRAKEQKTEFGFIQDPLLRDQLAKDWDEAQRVRGVQAWKSCVILCGGILEGMLLDVLKRDEQQAKSAYQKVRKGKAAPDLNRWELADLVDVAKSLGLLSKSAEHLGHGLREFRNLIHPGKQVREKVTLTQEEAEIAFNIVKVCLREFSSRFQDA